MKERRDSYEYRLRNPAGHFCSQLKSRASQRNLAFDLTKEYLEKLITPMKCSVTGIELIYDMSGAPNTVSIDRINTLEGYVKGNVRVVSWIYNRAKGNSTDEAVLEYLIKPLAK